MNFMQAAQLLNEGHALRCSSWNNPGYIVKDELGNVTFFDHNEPAFYQMTTEDALADDWEQVEKDLWTIVSVSHDKELMQGRLFVSYHICSGKEGSIINNHLVEEDELPQWSRYVDLDLMTTAHYLNEQDIAIIRNTISA